MTRDASNLRPKLSFELIEAALLRKNKSEQSSDFDLNSDKPSSSVVFRPAAVMVPLKQEKDGLRLILTKRAAHLKHHPGQISFPGGKVDDTDTSVEFAAYREAKEEINLHPWQAETLGTLPLHKTVTSFEVQPIVTRVSSDFRPIVDPGEVEEVFEVPLEHVLSTQNYFIEGRMWMGKPRRYYVVPYGPYYIWGATARMLRMFADRLEQAHETFR